MPGWLTTFWRSFSIGGVALGTLFFVASLTPTLVPRSFLMQGALSGACFAVGYGIGVGGRLLWAYMELPQPRERWLRPLKTVTAVLCAIAFVYYLWRTTGWQNSVRSVMGLDPVDSAHPLEVGALAIVTFLAIIALARLFRIVVRFIARQSGRILPRRVAAVIGVAVAIFVFWTIANGVLVSYTLKVLDSSFAALDALIEPDRPQPTDPLKTGSAASLVDWPLLGRAGREFIATGPTRDEIARVTQRDALEPIRVYVGLGAADTAEARAALALEELKRVGAFERSVLVVVTPTGTGWIDPSSLDAVEYLHHGDIASVALQYSYLTSPLSLLVQPNYGSEAARALFAAVYDHWITLPRDERPKLYLHGLSLGALNSARSTELFELLGDPIQGALWSGPPFASAIWRSVTNRRNPGTPEWLPQFRDGSFVRFMNQDGFTVPADTRWGPMRIVYLQYASDPITFFDYRDAFRRPDWMNAPRGRDVSPELSWYPIVTMLQLALDMAVAGGTPMGYGHVFAPEHYVEGWVAVTDPPGWSAESIEQLKQYLAARSRMAEE